MMSQREEPVFCSHRIGPPKEYDPRQSKFNEKLTQRIIELTCCFGRYGYRRIHQLPTSQGWQINHKRLERIWRQEGQSSIETTQTFKIMV